MFNINLANWFFSDKRELYTNWYVCNILLMICLLCTTAAHATSEPGSSSWFDDIPVESIEEVRVVVEDLP